MGEADLGIDEAALPALLTLLDRLGVAVFAGGDGRITQASSRFLELIGRSIEEVRALDVAHFMLPEERHLIAEVEGGAAPDGSTDRRRAVVVQPDATRVPLDVAIFVRPNAFGQITYLGLACDLRETERRDEQLARLSAMLDRTPVGALIWDGNGVTNPDDLRLLTANAAAVEVLGLDPQVDIGQRLGVLFPDVERDVGARLLALCGTDRVEHFGDVAYTNGRQPLTIFRWRAISAPGNVVAAMFEDVTEQRAEEMRRRELLERLVDTSDEQRRHLAMNVHDDPIQQLAAAAILVEGLRRHPNMPQRGERLASIDTALRAAMASLRHLVFELSPPELVESGLESAVRSAADYVFADRQVNVTVTADLRHQPANAVQVAAFRIVAEALTNAQKHARPSTITVDLQEDGHLLLVKVSDDGAGFEAAAERPGHIGLRSMRERAAALGGECIVSSRPGGGTIVAAHLPIDGRTGGDDSAVRRADAPTIDSREVVQLRRERDSLTLAAAEAREQATGARARLRDVLATMKAISDPSLSVTEVLRTSVERLGAMLGGGCAIHLVTPDGAILRRASSWHSDAAALDYLNAQIFIDRGATDSHMGVVLRSGAPVLLDWTSSPWRAGEVTGADDVTGAEAHPIEIRSVLIAAVQLPRHVLGTLTIVRERASPMLNADDVDFAACLAERVAIALHLASEVG